MGVNISIGTCSLCAGTRKDAVRRFFQQTRPSDLARRQTGRIQCQLSFRWQQWEWVLVSVNKLQGEVKAVWRHGDLPLLLWSSMSSHARKLCGMLIFILSTPTGSYSCMNLIIITIEKNALAVNEKSAGFTLHCSIVVNKPRGMASRYSAAQVCEILTGDSDKVEFLFPGSDDDLDAFELGEDGSDLEEEGGIPPSQFLFLLFSIPTFRINFLCFIRMELVKTNLYNDACKQTFLDIDTLCTVSK